MEDQDEKLENVKGNELSQKNDFERFSESSFSGYRQGGSQSLNANENFLNSWTPSTFANPTAFGAHVGGGSFAPWAALGLPWAQDGPSRGRPAGGWWGRDSGGQWWACEPAPC